MLLKKPQFKAAGFLAALNCLMILRASRYLFEINAIGSRTETEVVAVGAAAMAFFVVMPMLVIRHELTEPEKDASLFCQNETPDNAWPGFSCGFNPVDMLSDTSVSRLRAGFYE